MADENRINETTAESFTKDTAEKPTESPVESKTKTKKKVNLKERFQLSKSKILYSVLVCFSVFVLLVGSAYSSFFQNASQINFTFGDFAPLYTGLTALVCLIFFIILLLCRGLAHKLVFAAVASLGFIGGLQNMITTFSFSGLHGDGTAEPPTQVAQILNIGMWAALACVIVWLCALYKKSDFGRVIVSLGLVFVIVTQVGATAMEGISYASDPSKHNHKIEALSSSDSTESDEDTISYLTNLNMYEVSSKKNIIVILLDRFDAEYFDALMSNNCEYIDDLDGFTYYNDNIAKYPRTFPGVVSMLTGAEYDYETPKAEFLDTAYRNSTFIKDLKNNGYEINLFLPPSDGYNNAACFDGMVANTSDTTSYTISGKDDLLNTMFSLSSYFWSPEVFKANNNISVSSINEIVTLDGTAEEYKITAASDIDFYKGLCEQGLSTQSNSGTFTFLHLRGCHDPYTIDENCEYIYPNDLTATDQTTGMFKLIAEYIRQLKDKGLYEDATIIITGDHADLITDEDPYVEPELTALLVKESGQSGTPLKTSTAQVSQDNFLATIVKSAGLETEHDYGRAYSDIEEGETVVRTHYFDTKFVDVTEYFTYTITGCGRDFSNWKETKG